MTLTDSINRSVNLLGVALIGLSGFAFAPEMLLENDAPDKIDDALMLIIGLAGIWWYRRARNRFARSFVPVLLPILALATKIGAIIVEFDDKDAVGDDFGALILFVLAIGLMWWLYARAPKLAEEASGPLEAPQA